MIPLCVAQRVDSYNAGVVSSNPARVSIKTALVGKVTENHLIKSTSIKKIPALPLVSAKLEIGYATQFGYSLVNEWGWSREGAGKDWV